MHRGKREDSTMASLTIINARAVIGGAVRKCNLKVVDGKIKGIMPPGDTYGKTFDARENLILPGFIDIHTHGANGVDFNHAEAKDVRGVRDFFASQGTTTFLPAIMTDTEENMLRSILSVVQAKNTLKCSQIYGIHLEGPFLDAAYKGAMPEELLQPCSYPLFKRLQDASGGQIRLITLSPELEGAAELTKRLSMEGVRVSLGHSGADYETAVRCIEAGAISATHTFNAMKPLHHHAPAITTAVLESDGYCEAICDGKHLHPAVFRLLLKTKGLGRVIAVTDSMMAAGMREGIYKLGNNNVVVRGGEAKIMGTDVHAGSILTTIQALRNMMEFTGLPVEKVVPLLTENPARMLGIFHRKGSLDVGKDADMVMLDDKYRVLATFSEGELLYQAGK